MTACSGGASTKPATPATITSARHGATVGHVASVRRTSCGPGDIEVNATNNDCGTGAVGDEVGGGGLWHRGRQGRSRRRRICDWRWVSFFHDLAMLAHVNGAPVRSGKGQYGTACR
jgi:hypothetical protein